MLDRTIFTIILTGCLIINIVHSAPYFLKYNADFKEVNKGSANAVKRRSVSAAGGVGISNVYTFVQTIASAAAGVGVGAGAYAYAEGADKAASQLLSSLGLITTNNGQILDSAVNANTGTGN